MEAESGSLFDTLVKLILKVPREEAIYVAFSGRVGRNPLLQGRVKQRL
jgi:hypothetical protein